MSEQEFWRGCPAVEVNPNKLGGRPTVGAYRLAAQDVADLAEDGLTAEEIVAQFPGTPIDRVKAVLSYWYSRSPELTPSR